MKDSVITLLLKNYMYVESKQLIVKCNSLY